MDKPAVLYRYVGHSMWYEDMLIPTCSIDLEIFPILKYTLKGYWINKNKYDIPKIEKGINPKYHKFILSTGRKRFAYPNKETAWESFKLRKHWQIIHLENQLKVTKICYEMAKQNITTSRNMETTINEPTTLHF